MTHTFAARSLQNAAQHLAKQLDEVKTDSEYAEVDAAAHICKALSRLAWAEADCETSIAVTLTAMRRGAL